MKLRIVKCNYTGVYSLQRRIMLMWTTVAVSANLDTIYEVARKLTITKKEIEIIREWNVN